MPPEAIRILRYKIVSPLSHPKLSFANGVIRLKKPIFAKSHMKAKTIFYSRFHHDEGAEEREEDVDCDRDRDDIVLRRFVVLQLKSRQCSVTVTVSRSIIQLVNYRYFLFLVDRSFELPIQLFLLSLPVCFIRDIRARILVLDKNPGKEGDYAGSSTYCIYPPEVFQIR